MNSDKNFYVCKVCGNVTELIEDSSVKIMCCNQEMTQVLPNTVDAAHEKHIPIATLKGNSLTVTVSSVIHPMTSEHHIAWIAIIQGNKIQRVTLDPTSSPVATFKVGNGKITILEYCNLHGLWTADIQDYNYDFNDEVCSPEFSEGCI